MIDRAKLTAAVRYVLREFGVAAPSEMPLRVDADSDGYVISMMLPWRVERVTLSVEDAGNHERIVALIEGARDKLFRANLEHMAEHDYEIRAALEAMERNAAKRERVLAILKDPPSEEPAT